MIKAAIYLRVSTRDQSVHGYGLDAQETKCRQYLQLYEYGGEDTKIYKDDGYSAKSLDRPHLMEMMNDVRNGKINMIVVYKLDRLARSVIDTYSLIQELQKYECQLVAVVDRLDINSANGRMIVGILAVFAQWEREVIIERTIDGLESMANQGKYPSCGVPFGYNKDKQKYITVNEKEAKIINDLADKCIDGMSLPQLSRYLNKTYGIYKSGDAIRKILIRDINRGLYKYHDKEYTDTFPAIMSEKKLKRVRTTIKKHAKPDKEKYLFHSRVMCNCGTRCDNRMTKKIAGQTPKYYYYYECPECKKRISQVRLLNDVIIHILCHDARERLSNEIKEKEMKLLSLRKEIKKVHRKYDDELIDINTYSEMVKRMMNRMKKLKEQIIGLNIKGKLDFFDSTDVEKHAYIQSKVRMIQVDMDFKIATNIEWKGDVFK